MNYTISPNRRTLTIHADEAERAELREATLENPDFQSDRFLADFLEPLTCNSQLEWIYPEHTGDLTDAPMLGICDWSAQATSDTPKVLERWAWMQYETRSVLEVLRDKGHAVFVS